MVYDLLLKGGRVVDPAQGISGLADVAIANGAIAAVGDLAATDAARVIDVGGRIVTPGLIDLHTHLYTGVSDLGVDPDTYCLAHGVTTAVDVGSSGSITFPGFRDYVIKRSRCRVYAFIHLASIGLIAHRVGELRDMAYADPEGCQRMIEENRDRILGIKVRMGRPMINGFGLKPLEMALEIAERTGVKVMAHIGESPIYLGDILNMLRPGDIATHILNGKPVENILDTNGTVIPEVWKAIDRGVYLDVGHGYGSFCYRVVRAALAQGFKPHGISTDLHLFSIDGPVYNLATVMSKFLEFGLSLDEVVERATINPARILGMADRVGSLRPGMAADVAVFDLQQGEFEFWDARQDRKELNPESMIAHQRLAPVLTVVGGEIVDAPAPSAIGVR